MSVHPTKSNTKFTSVDVPLTGIVTTAVLQCNTLWMQIQCNVKKEQKQNCKKIDI